MWVKIEDQKKKKKGRKTNFLAKNRHPPSPWTSGGQGGGARGTAGAGLCGAQHTGMGSTSLEANARAGSDQAGFIQGSQI